MIRKVNITIEGTIEMWNECEEILKDLQENLEEYLHHENPVVRYASEQLYEGFYMAYPPNIFRPRANIYLQLSRLYRNLLWIQHPELNPHAERAG